MEWSDFSITGELETLVGSVESELRGFLSPSPTQPPCAALPSAPLTVQHAVCPGASGSLYRLTLLRPRTRALAPAPATCTSDAGTTPSLPLLSLASAIGATAFTPLALGATSLLGKDSGVAEDCETACALRVRLGITGTLVLLKKAPTFISTLLPDFSGAERREARLLLSTALLAAENVGLRQAGAAVVVQVDCAGPGTGSFLGSAWDEGRGAHTELRMGSLPLWSTAWDDKEEAAAGGSSGSIRAGMHMEGSRSRLVTSLAPLATLPGLRAYLSKKVIDSATLLRGKGCEAVDAASACPQHATVALRWRLGWRALRSLCDFLGAPPVASALELVCVWSGLCEEGRAGPGPLHPHAPSAADMLTAPLMALRVCERGESPGALLQWERGLGNEAALQEARKLQGLRMPLEWLEERGKGWAAAVEPVQCEAISVNPEAGAVEVGQVALLYQACAPALGSARRVSCSPGAGARSGLHSSPLLQLAHPRASCLATLLAALEGALLVEAEGAESEGYALVGARELDNIATGRAAAEFFRVLGVRDSQEGSGGARSSPSSRGSPSEEPLGEGAGGSAAQQAPRDGPYSSFPGATAAALLSTAESWPLSRHQLSVPPADVCTMASIQGCVDAAMEQWEGSAGDILEGLALGVGDVCSAAMHYEGGEGGGGSGGDAAAAEACDATAAPEAEAASFSEAAAHARAPIESLWDWLKTVHSCGAAQPAAQVLQVTLHRAVGTAWGALVKALRGKWELVEEGAVRQVAAERLLPARVARDPLGAEYAALALPQCSLQLELQQQLWVLKQCFSACTDTAGAHASAVLSAGGAGLEDTLLQLPAPCTASQAMADARICHRMGVTAPQACALAGVAQCGGRPIRQQPSVAVIVSDMAAYKAAAGESAALRAFLAWYFDLGGEAAGAASPLPPDGTALCAGWETLWDSVSPCHAAQQRPLMSAHSLAQRTLGALESASASQVTVQLLAAALSALLPQAPAAIAWRRAAATLLLPLCALSGEGGAEGAGAGAADVFLREARGGLRDAAEALCVGTLAAEAGEYKAGRLQGLLTAAARAIASEGGGEGTQATLQEEIRALAFACVLPPGAAQGSAAKEDFFPSAVNGALVQAQLPAAATATPPASRPWCTLPASSQRLRETLVALVQDCCLGSGGEEAAALGCSAPLPPPCKYALVLCSAGEREGMPQTPGAAPPPQPLRHAAIAEVDLLGGSDARGGYLCLALALQERE